MVPNAFKSGLFSIPSTEGTWIKIFTSKQVLQKLPIAFPQVKQCNTPESLLNEICQVLCSLYERKEITKKVYNNIQNCIQI